MAESKGTWMYDCESQFKVEGVGILKRVWSVLQHVERRGMDGIGHRLGPGASE